MSLVLGALTLSLTGCVANSECPPLLDHQAAASCPSHVDYAGGSYLIVGSCIPKSQLGPELNDSGLDSGPILRSIRGVSPDEAIALESNGEPCAWTWGYYHELSKAEVRQLKINLGNLPIRSSEGN